MKTGDFFDFYEIDIDYIKYLYNYDKQVFYNEFDPNYEDKPYIGIIIMYNTYKYFIPLTSAKEKHKNLSNTGKEHLLIHEQLLRNQIVEEKDIFKLIEKGEKQECDIVKKIYALIDFQKAIPIPNCFFEQVTIVGHKNQDLLQKEFDFCISKKSTIIAKTICAINNQHTTHIINVGQCDYSLLEKLCKQWSFEHLSIIRKEEFFSNEIVYIDKNVDFINLVNISESVVNFEVKNFDNTNIEIQEVTICVYDEFNQEKSIVIRVKIKDEAILDSNILQKKESVGTM